MTNSINYTIPNYPSNYSGVTINITSPTVNTNPNGCLPTCQHYNPNTISTCQYLPEYTKQTLPNTTNISQNQKEIIENKAHARTLSKENTDTDYTTTQKHNAYSQYGQTNNFDKQTTTNLAYPASYYINTFNPELNAQDIKSEEGHSEHKLETNASQYVEKQTATSASSSKENLNLNKENIVLKETPHNSIHNIQAINESNTNNEKDLTSSQEIIKDLDSRLAAQEELEKNGTQKKIVALTNEYIMSLENYLNNPNIEMRLMAAKEILTRLDEDRSRFDDAALNALLNKMMQDPEKIIRIAALSALSSGLASGNEYTVELLHNIQNNTHSDKEDAVEAANILLQMSANTETRYEKSN